MRCSCLIRGHPPGSCASLLSFSGVTKGTEEAPSSTPLRSGGLPLWAAAPSPGPQGRTKPRPATPAPKPGLKSPSAFQQNIGTRKMTRERNISRTQPSRQPNAAGATDAHTPTPPAACGRNALSALLRGIKRKRKPLGWRALAPCVTCPHPETDRLEAKQLRVCVLSKRELRY